MAPGVAGDARAVAELLDLEQHDVVVAVQAQLMHLLDVARLLALVPQAVARAAEVHRLAELCRARERLPVHEGEHQHVVAAELLRNRRYQALRVPLDLIEPVHRGSVAISRDASGRQNRVLRRTIAAPEACLAAPVSPAPAGLAR